jgi:hypothetical protein
MSATHQWANAGHCTVSILDQGDEIGGEFVDGEVAVVFSADSDHLIIEGTHLQVMALLAGANAEVAQHLKDQRNK